jgi:hypothetical protein
MTGATRKSLSTKLVATVSTTNMKQTLKEIQKQAYELEKLRINRWDAKTNKLIEPVKLPVICECNHA